MVSGCVNIKFSDNELFNYTADSTPSGINIKRVVLGHRSNKSLLDYFG